MLKRAQKLLAGLSNILALAANEVMLKNICLLEKEKELRPLQIAKNARPKQGDCCVFFSYGTVSYHPIQLNNSCCC